jgi:hypothetical protein
LKINIENRTNKMSCLFNSLSYFFQEPSNTIRQKICDYLQNNNVIMDGLDTQFILQLENQNYVQHMRNTSTWGGAIEIQASCNLYNVIIIVRNHRDHNGKNIEFLPINVSNKDDLRKIELEWSGGHYEPVRN